MGTAISCTPPSRKACSSAGTSPSAVSTRAPPRVMSSRVRDEIWISERHAKIGKTVGRLLPANHAVGIVLQDQHHKIEPQAHCRFRLLRIHHKAAVAAHREHPSLWMEQRGHNPRRLNAGNAVSQELI